MSVMTSILRRHGAVLVARQGRLIAAHYESVPGEVAVCEQSVGLAERSDRATLAVVGPESEIDAALAGIVSLAEHAWAVHSWQGHALVRCDGESTDAVIAALRAAEDMSIDDVSDDHVALQLIGPRAQDVLAATRIDLDTEPVTIVAEPHSIELVTTRQQGPALWNRLLAAGAEFGIACVGIEALEHVAVVDQLDRLRRHSA